MEYSMEMVAAQLRRPEGDVGGEIAKKMNDSNTEMINRAIKILNCQPGDKVVEVGAGNGLTSIDVLNAIGVTGKYIVIDYSDDMLKLVRKNLEEIGFFNYQLINNDCLEVEDFFQANKIFASNLLYFIEDLSLLVDRIRRWCGPEAQIVFAVRSKKSMLQLPFTQHNFILRDESDYIKEFKKSGVDVSIDTFIDESKTLDGLVVNTDFHIIQVKI